MTTADDKLIRAAKLARRDQVLMEKRAAKQQRKLQRKCFWTGRWGHAYEPVTEEVLSPTPTDPDRVVMVKLRQCVGCRKQVI